MQQPDPPPESVARLTAVAVGWMLLSHVSMMAVAFAVALLAGPAPQWEPWSGAAEVEISQMSLFALLLFASVIRARVVGNGNIRIGLGDCSITEPVVVACLAIVMVAHAVLVNIQQYQVRPELFSQEPLLDLMYPGRSAFLAFRYIAIGPLAEELFFRGWLWTGLRKHSSALPTAVLTGMLWVVMHLPTGGRSLGLIADAIVLSAARHLGSSVRASVALHAIYNGAFLISTWLVTQRFL